MIWKILSKELLFYKKFYPFSYSYFRGSGRNQSGRTTSWSRQTISFKQLRPSPFVSGCFKIYRSYLLPNSQAVNTYGVNQFGLILNLVMVRNCSDYVYYSLRPSLSNQGNRMPLRWIPVGVKVCWSNYYARSGGTFIQVLRHRLNFTQLRLPSKKIIWVNSFQLATIGVNGKTKHKHHKNQKAGDLKFLGFKPRVRGVAMNPVDHPHGGGQGKTSGGRPGCSPWGQLSKGYKTKRHPQLNFNPQHLTILK